MDVSVIIVNYNTAEQVCVLLESILKQTKGIKYEIIIADNASSDNSYNIINQKFSNKILWLAMPENLGFARANNEGIKSASGRNIFFLNPDTILQNNAIKILSDFLDKNPETGIIGGNLFDHNKAPAYSFRRFLPSVFWELNEFFSLLPEKILYNKNAQFNNKNEPREVAYITGADLMIPRRVLDNIGFFDPTFFLYFEETDLAYRAKRAGFKVMNIPEAEIIHNEGSSFDSGYNRWYQYTRGKINYYKKNSNPILFHLILTLNRLTIYLRIIIFSVFYNNVKLNRWKIIKEAYLNAMKHYKD